MGEVRFVDESFSKLLNIPLEIFVVGSLLEMGLKLSVTPHHTRIMFKAEFHKMRLA
jgi:hypothetical protein